MEDGMIDMLAMELEASVGATGVDDADEDHTAQVEADDVVTGCTGTTGVLLDQTAQVDADDVVTG